ncbi:hypothetical protein EBE87_24440 [Pseudoroseomonas wenyumeiae]|uniref:Transposase n=1 Tax=Teichococcus wenyumeiae TaxID=2478470 RepID=A0A3A9JWS3_9PROT|nr:hypothetical protein D6Z83_14230 [Pseudoroseomonas wenyumeiae]RMI16994.1 hypothetical protein EBE87_24440 [Pseudoroseomonas wenyumeiae]
MATRTGREITAEFKREAMALLQGGGRPLTRVAVELGIQLSMLRHWRAAQNGNLPRSRTRQPEGGAVAMGPMAPSPAGLASENARLRRELDRARMERDVLKKPSASSRRCRNEICLHRATCRHLPGSPHVPRARGVAKRLLRQAATTPSGAALRVRTRLRTASS